MAEIVLGDEVYQKRMLIDSVFVLFETPEIYGEG